MNVLAVLMADAAVTDGYAGHLTHIVETLRHDGHHVRVVAYSSGGRRMTQEERFVAARARFRHVRVVAQAAAEIFLWRPDVAVITSLGALYNPLLIACCKAAGARIIYDCHDPIVESLRIWHRERPLIRRLIPLLAFTDRCFDRWAYATFVVSAGMAKMMRVRGWRSPMRFFYNTHSAAALATGALVPATLPLPAPDVFVIVYEGGLQRHLRGIEEQFEACALLLARGITPMLWLVGGGEREYFEALARRMRMSEHVRIDGPVTASQLATILQRADAAVWNGISVGLPSKVFDYIAKGVPILSRDDQASDVNTLCRDFVHVYGSTAAQLADALAARAAALPRDRARRSDRVRAGLDFILALHHASEASLREVFQRIAQTATSASQSQSEA